MSVSAAAAGGYQFSGFSGALSGTTNPQSLMVNATESVVANFTAVPSGPTITTTSPLPDGTVYVPYSRAFAATGGTTPYTWSVASGSLPAGLSLSTGGTLSGTPTVAATYTFTIRVSDRNSHSASKQFALTIYSTTPVITTASLPDASVNTQYSQTFAAAGGTPPYTWSQTSGTLPTGFSLSSSGVLSGRATTSNSYTFKVQVKDSLGRSSSAVSFTLNVTMSFVVTSSPTGISLTVDSVPCTTPCGFQWVSSSVHTLAAPGTQAGGTGIQYVYASWSDSGAQTHSITAPSISRTYTANFATQYYLTTSASPAAGGSITPGGWYNSGAIATVSATPNAGYVFTGFSGSLSGTTNPGSLTMTGPMSVAASFNSTSPVLILTTSLPVANAGAPYSATLAASGGTPPYSWSVAAGSSLPSGLALNPATGGITGNPAGSGNFQFTVQVNDAKGVPASQTLSLTVALPTLSINGGSNSAEVASSTSVSLAFNLYDQANGANDIAWGQFYLADSSGNPYCYGDWGRPDGLDLYDGNTGTTHGFGINQSDSACTVSLASITNSPSDPTEVTLVLNFNFNPSPGGTYTVLTQVNYSSGYAGPWEALGTLIIDPAREPVTSPPEYQPPPETAPLPTPPSPVPTAANVCSDMSGVWSDPNTQANAEWSLSQSGSIVSGSLKQTTTAGGVCPSPVAVQWTVNGTSNDSSAHLDAGSPSPASFQCGEYTVVEPTAISVDLNPDCNSAAVTNWTSTYPPPTAPSLADPRLASPESYQPFTRPGPPGVTVTVDLMAGSIKTDLTGQNKTGNLTVAINNSQGQEVLSKPHNSAQAGDSFTDTFRTLIQAGQQYGSVAVTWDIATVTIPFPASFFTIGLTHFTQYNTPYHSSCSGNPQPALLINKIDSQYCYYQDVMLGSDFAKAVFQNGTGVWDVNGTNTVLKSYDAGAKATPKNIGCPLYEGFDNRNTFFSVDAGGNPITKINGSHWSTVLSDGTGPGNGSVLNNYNPPPGSLATDPNATNKGSPPVYLWSDALLLFDQSDKNDSRWLRSVQDLCPACAGQATEQPGAPAHIDMYNGTSQSCVAHSVGDYGSGYYYAIRLR